MSQGEYYLKLAAKAGDRSLDSSYRAAFYLLSADPELAEAAAKHVSINGISFTGVKRDTRGFDDASRQIVDIAHNLFSWNSKCKVTPFDISRLGYPYMAQVCNALFIASGEYQIVIEADQENNLLLKLDKTPYQRTQRIHRQLSQIYETKQEETHDNMDMVR